jgi:hypothetical protein
MHADTAGSPSESPLPRRRAGGRLKVLAILAIALVVMASGAAIGAALTVMYFRSRLFPPAATTDGTEKAIMDRLSGSVELTGEETETIRKIVRESISAIGAIRQEYDGEINQRLGTMRGEISEVLGPERSRRCGHWMHGSDETDPGADSNPEPFRMRRRGRHHR